MSKKEKRIPVLLLIVAVLAASLGGFLWHVSKKANTWSGRGALTIYSTDKNIYRILNDFKLWENWVSLEQHSPKPKIVVSENSSGEGATYDWAGDNYTGSGHLEITRASEPLRIQMNLTKPFNGQFDIAFRVGTPGDRPPMLMWEANGSFD